jgi:beta-galactosidase
MKRNFCKNILTAKPIILLVLFLIYSKAAASQEYSSTRLSLDKDWRFHRGDVPFPVIKGHGVSYSAAKAGKARGAAAPDFDDSQWRLLYLNQY